MEDLLVIEEIVTNVMYLQEINIKEESLDDFPVFLERQVERNGNF